MKATRRTARTPGSGQSGQSGQAGRTGTDTARRGSASGRIGGEAGATADPDGGGPVYRRHSDLHAEGAR